MELEQLFEDRPEHGLLVRVLNSLRQIRVPVVAYESEIHQIISDQLRESKIPYLREYRLGPRCRIDFYITGGVGVEVKKGVPATAALIVQLERYTKSTEIQAMVLVVERKAYIPADTINGKPCITLGLNQLWGVAI